MKYEIVIRNLETVEEELRNECDEFAVIAMDEQGKATAGMFNSNVDHASDVMARDAVLRAACRLAVAKYEAAREIRDFESRKKMKSLADIFAGAVNED